jgi:hypothetical protein
MKKLNDDLAKYHASATAAAKEAELKKLHDDLEKHNASLEAQRVSTAATAAHGRAPEEAHTAHGRGHPSMGSIQEAPHAPSSLRPWTSGREDSSHELALARGKKFPPARPLPLKDGRQEARSEAHFFHLAPEDEKNKCQAAGCKDTASTWGQCARFAAHCNRGEKLKSCMQRYRQTQTNRSRIDLLGLLTQHPNTRCEDKKGLEDLYSEDWTNPPNTETEIERDYDQEWKSPSSPQSREKAQMKDLHDDLEKRHASAAAAAVAKAAKKAQMKNLHEDLDKHHASLLHAAEGAWKPDLKKMAEDRRQKARSEERFFHGGEHVKERPAPQADETDETDEDGLEDLCQAFGCHENELLVGSSNQRGCKERSNRVPTRAQGMALRKVPTNYRCDSEAEKQGVLSNLFGYVKQQLRPRPLPASGTQRGTEAFGAIHGETSGFPDAG